MKHLLRLSFCRFLSFLLCLVLPLLFTLSCKKGEDTPVTPTPQPSTQIKPGENVGLGANLLSQEAYQALPLLKDPLVGARIAADKLPNLPATYELTANMPPVDNQGMQGSCTAWAVAYAARSYFNKVAKQANYTAPDGKPNQEALFSPAFVYNQVKVNGCANGSSIKDALDLLQTAGVCSLKDMPYSETDCSTQPTAEQKQKAAAYKIKKWARINISPATFRRFLYFDYPIIFASTLDNNFMRLKEKDASGDYIWKSYDASSASGGHAMVLVGYDDQKKAFKLQNSWSDRWANKGYLWLSYDIVERAVQEAYVMVAGDNADLKVPTVETEVASVTANAPVVLKATIKDLGGGAIIRYGFCISKTSLLPTEQSEVAGNITQVPYSFSLSANQLMPNQTYYYRAFVETPDAVYYGAAKTVKTPAQAASDPTRQAGTLIVHTPKSIYAVNTATGDVKWEFNQSTDLGEGGVISPNIYDNRYFVGARNNFYALNLQGGQIMWQSTAKTNPGTIPVAYHGSQFLIYSVDGNTVYALDYYGNKKWEYVTSNNTNSSITANLTVSGNLIFVTSSFNNKIFALDATTGQLKREFNGGSSSGNPAVVSNTLYTITTSKVIAYDIDTGNTVWDYAGTFEKDQSPTIYKNTILFTTGSGTTTPKLVAVEANTGKTKWTYSGYQANSSISDPNIENDIVITKSKTFDPLYSDVYALDFATGQLKWKMGSYIATDPINTGSNVFVLNTRADGSRPGSVTVYDAQGGKIIWQVENVKSAGTLSFVNTFGQIFYITKSGMKQ
ncbi:PQQ-binding-like beta-propeller repeat protein [Spirosoma soli]|uniref:PQQ-binding-like beta-propeller repeat protein n=1 Tax=Spirosoma soli TaxID=1770529 RepID=A0ABW5MBU4_9BACT